LIPTYEGSSPSSPAKVCTQQTARPEPPPDPALKANAVLFNTVLFTGNANRELAQEIASNLGVELGKANVGRFSDGEVTVELLQNVRARDVFVVQSTCAPTNDNLMELLIMVDALKRASARRITAVIPYFGYARQDRRPRSTRVPISAKVVANLLETVGIERVLTMDLHADQIQGFFDIPVDNIYASPVLLSDLKSKNYQNLIVVSPDIGGVVRARALAKQLSCDLAIIDKRRSAANVSEVMHVIGEIEGRNCVIMDDMIDTAGTLVKAAEVLKERGAKSVYAYCTHAVFSGPAIERIKASALDEVVICNTIPLSDSARACSKIRQLSVAFLFAETIRRISDGESVTSLFAEQNSNF
jgi:ribose-phosphate pyrophosphokinase